MATTVVLYPSVGVGHLIPMVQLANLFLRRGFLVTIAVIKPSDAAPSSEAAVARLAAANPGITFHTLPAVNAAPASADVFTRNLETVRLNNAGLADFLRSTKAAALVVDMFCTDGFDAAAEAGVPGYVYFTSAASALAAFFHLTHLHLTTTASLADMDELIRVAGLPALRPADLPAVLQRREWDSYKGRIHAWSRIPEAAAILVNSFEWLEAAALRALNDGACLPHRPTPRVSCVGPLVDAGTGAEGHASLAWLDEQPERSVVFLCFGSVGAFSEKQIKAIAAGLERSGQRFLWVLRGASPDGRNRQSFAVAEPDLELLLPGGFLERTKSIGMVVKSWAPQAAVLRHTATGAFVTHCGWNSTLEAVAAGLPMVCWPMYAEQRMNKVFIVEEMRLGVEMVGYDKEMVAAEEIEKKVRWVMESPEAEEIRRRAAAAKEKAAESVAPGGPSESAFGEFLRAAGL